MKFREQFMRNEIAFDEIFALTDQWNFSDDPCTLREYLGLTAQEEDIWISESDDALEDFMEQEKRTKAIFLDLDGTLFTDDKQFSPKNKAALSRALDAGHQIVITTGRPLVSAAAQAQALGFDKKGCYVIAFNGGEIYDMYHKKSLYRKTIPLPLVRRIFDAAYERGLHCQTYNAHEILAEHETDALCRYSEITKVPYRIVPDVIAALKEEPVKMIVMDYEDPQKLQTYLQETAAVVSGKIDRFFSCPEYLEHVAPEVSKGAAVKMLCARTGIPLCNTIAAGDAENDISMIQAAAIGCAMKNAIPAVKEAADYITENDNNHDGVAEIVEKFCF